VAGPARPEEQREEGGEVGGEEDDDGCVLGVAPAAQGALHVPKELGKGLLPLNHFFRFFDFDRSIDRSGKLKWQISKKPNFQKRKKD
jgi:hypothetical protein